MSLHAYQLQVVLTLTQSVVLPSALDITFPNVSFERKPSFGLLELTSQNITECFKGIRSYQQFFASNGTISIHHDVEGNVTDDQLKRKECTLDVILPAEKVARLQFGDVDVPCDSADLVIKSMFNSVLSMCTNAWRTPGTYWMKSMPAFYTPLNEITILIIQKRGDEPFSFTLNFTAVSESERPQLELISVTETSGYIQTPGLDRGQPYPLVMSSWIHVSVPPDHALMVSFSRMDVGGRQSSCHDDKVTLHLRDRRDVLRDKLTLEYCYDVIPDPQLYRVDFLNVEFSSDYYGENSGFRLRFSFHNASSLLHKTSEGRWNCSVTYWSDFRHHFPCNLVSDCAAGEDELNCPYTGVCGPGFLTISGRCYVYVIPPPSQRFDWDDAAEVCHLRHSGYLASLNTPAEWNDVTSTLRLRPFDRVYVGLHSAPSRLPFMYKRTWWWSDQTLAIFFNMTSQNTELSCHVRKADWTLSKQAGEYVWSTGGCETGRVPRALCEIGDVPLGPVQPDFTVRFPEVSELNIPSHHFVCPALHFTHSFLACDVKSACAVRSFSEACSAALTPLPPSFACTDGAGDVPYTLVCDHHPDCGDDSDETFCRFPPCHGSSFNCGGSQCVRKGALCDDVVDCVNGYDEDRCAWGIEESGLLSFEEPQPFVSTLPPSVVVFGTKAAVFITSPLAMHNGSLSAGGNITCPETHFQCADNGYCLPVYVMCNGVYDCPGREDEASCESHACPGFYRCRASRVCLHVTHVCDGEPQCPQRDDELLCGFDCPASCRCHGLAFFCQRFFHPTSYPRLRFLDASGSGMTPSDLVNNSMLVHLNLARCSLNDIHRLSLPNLRLLDLSDNGLRWLRHDQLAGSSNLHTLVLAGNPLLSVDITERLPSVNSLDVSRLALENVLSDIVVVFVKLRALNASGCRVNTVRSPGFKPLADLEVLDLRESRVTFFPPDIFSGLKNLRTVYAGNYKLCCSATLPDGFNRLNCHAPADEISSCQNLLQTDLFRVFTAIFSVVALLGNWGSFVYRVFVQKAGGGVGYSSFVTHLSVSDSLMGAYLAIIGVADWVFRGSYVWNDVQWTHSATCRLAGFLSLVSSEVSAFLVCLITLDRFLVLRFPFSRVRFGVRSAHVACCLSWAVGVSLAAVPLLPSLAHWRFYSQSGICIPLPISSSYFPGHTYSFGIIIVMNFGLFLLIAAGQMSIFLSIRSNTISSADTTKKSKDLTIARRLITIAVSDFLCWFPIGLLGILAAQGFSVPGSVGVAMAIFVLPLNSALNPFLYTINMVLERRRREREKRLEKMLLANLQGQGHGVGLLAVTSDVAWETFSAWLDKGLLAPDRVTSRVTQGQDTAKTQGTQTN